MTSPDPAVHPHGDLVNPDVHHEESDINLRALVWFVVVLTLVVIGVDVVTWGMFKVLNRYEASNEPFTTPLAVPVGQAPAEPRLQTTPWVDLKNLRTQEHEYLNSYGWVDEKMGVVRIPIAKAKAMLLQRGIPVRPELGDAAEGTHIQSTGESNGGRTLPAGLPDRSSPSGLAAPKTPEAPKSEPAAPKSPQAPKAGGGQ